MTADFDAVVVGAGVIGLAIAREISLTGRSVLVIEKAASIGLETSSRNSEVIHAGIYYPTGSLKARFCVEGRDLMYAFCASHGVETRRLGKLIVATSAADEATLETVHARAKANGVANLLWLTAAEAKSLEPEITCTKALFSPSTGIVDAKGFMLALQGEAEACGASFAFKTTFESAACTDGVFSIAARGSDGDTVTLTCRALFNCAGHGARPVAMAVAGFPSSALPEQYFAKGSYCSLAGRSPFQHLIYPVPESGGLGIHATLDLGGAVRFGPDVTWTDGVDYSLPGGLPEKFSGAIARYWPGVHDRKLSPSYCGVRPKVHGPDTGFADFLIQGAPQHGIQGLVNLYGIESPGLTASLAIARHVAGTVA